MADSNTESATDRDVEYARLLNDDLNQELEKRGATVEMIASLQRVIERNQSNLYAGIKELKALVESFERKIDDNDLYREVEKLRKIDFRPEAEHSEGDYLLAKKIVEVLQGLTPILQSIGFIKAHESGFNILKFKATIEIQERLLSGSRERIKNLLAILIPLRKRITTSTDLTDVDSLILLDKENQEAIDLG